MFFGTNALDQSNQANYGLLQGITGGDRGRTFLNSPLDIRFRINNSDRMVLAGDGQLSIGGSDPAGFRLLLNSRAEQLQNALGIRADSPVRGRDLLTLMRIGNDGDYQMIHKASGYWGHNTLALHCEAGDALGFYSTNWTPLLELEGKTGNTYIRGRLEVGSSDIYFTDPNHSHTGIGNVLGYAAIENSVNFGALMILGRMTSSTATARVVKVWDILEMNGDMVIHGTLNGHGADLAEMYMSTEKLEPGDVVSLASDRDEIGAAGSPRDQNVIGVVSANPGFVLNSKPGPKDDADGNEAYPVALCGRVPCKVTDEGGPI